MVYATLADFISLFGQREMIVLTDRENTGDVDEALLSDAIARASAEIDRKLVPRYTLPLAEVPPALRRICCDMVRFDLSGSEVNETSVVVARNAQARKDLDAIRDGRDGLGLDAEAKPITDTGSVRVNAPRRQFTGDSLRDY